jgi:hypothetical protein
MVVVVRALALMGPLAESRLVDSWVWHRFCAEQCQIGEVSACVRDSAHGSMCIGDRWCGPAMFGTVLWHSQLAGGNSWCMSVTDMGITSHVHRLLLTSQ